MTTTIPRSEIIRQYCREGTAEQIAYGLNAHYRMKDLFLRPVTAREIERIWAEEIEHNIVLRELGDRPAKGFPKSAQTELAERLVAA